MNNYDEDEEDDNYTFPSEEDRDAPDDADVRVFDRHDFIRCPNCGKSNHPEAAACRFCRRLLTGQAGAKGARPQWVKVTAIVALVLAVLMAIFNFFGGDGIIRFEFPHWHW